MLKEDWAYLISGCDISAAANSLFALSKSLNSPPNLSNKFTSKPDELPNPRILGGEKKIILASGIFATSPKSLPVIAVADSEGSSRSSQFASFIIPNP